MQQQLEQLPLWFETGAVQPDGYSVEGALKALLFEMLESGGEVDLQQLLLYCCDSPATVQGPRYTATLPRAR